jgi:hypothetical protein
MHVLIKNGTWRTTTIDNQIFEVHLPFKPNPHNPDKGHINVVGTTEKGLNNTKCRIDVKVGDFEYVNEDGSPYVAAIADDVKVGDIIKVDYEKKFREIETETDAMVRIGRTFELFGHIVEAVINNNIKGLIVSGPPGIGKTYTVEEKLYSEYGYESRHYEIIKGFASPIAIYQALYRNSSKKNVIVFDDCDDAFEDETALNILKNALDTGDRRMINWLAESKILAAADVPDRFEFNGGIIFLTNKDFENSTSRLRPHFDAMMSRCHYLDLELGSQRDQLLRIKQIVDAGLLDDYELSNIDQDIIMDFVYTNFNFLREHSLRIVKKVADIYVSQGDIWQEIAESTCLRKQARYERLYKQKVAPSMKLVSC